MSGGLVALLDDVAAIAKVAASSLDDIAAAAGKADATCEPRALTTTKPEAGATRGSARSKRPLREIASPCTSCALSPAVAR